MDFQSLAFWGFFAGVLLAYYAVPRRFQVAVLLVASYWFYAGAGLPYLLLLIGQSALVYGAARVVDTARGEKGRKALFVLALVVCFGNLFFFKYYSALAGLLQSAWGLALPQFSLGLLAPLGISFYTFTATGYLIDVYQHVLPAQKSFLRVALFIGFFPQISSGPIERAANFLPQLEMGIQHNYERIARGLTRVLFGFFEKCVVANNLALMVDAVYHDMTQYTGPYLLLASLLYSYQIFCDFAGYSNIAIGIADMLGFTIVENFNRPFAARSFTELWQRWHISLTNWFRDYVFTPLSFASRGARNRKLAGYACLFVIFPLSGIWHGPTLCFLLWGVLNGAFLVFGKATAKKRRALAKKNPLYRNQTVRAICGMGLSYLLFTSCIVFFRAQSLADGLYVYTHLFTGWLEALRAPGLVVATLKSMNIGRVTMLLSAGGIMLVELLQWAAAKRSVSVSTYIRSLAPAGRITLYYVQILLLFFFGVLGTSSFIYFKF